MPNMLIVPRLTRRELLKTGASAAALAALPRPLLVQLGRTPEPVPPINDPRLKALVMRGLEAARSAGATYADVRLVHRRWRGLTTTTFNDTDRMGVGVRALVSGYWGFAASSLWSADELARLGREAAHQAKTIAGWKPRTVDLAPTPVVADGHWATPIRYDPFEVPFEEFQDYFVGLKIVGQRWPGVRRASADAGFWMEDKAFGSTEGSYCTQRKFKGGVNWVVEGPNLDGTEPFAGAGGEGGRLSLTREESDAAYHERVRERWEQERRKPGPLPEKMVEVGRYDAVFSAYAMGEVLSRTLGQATQLDRALGYEANADGTSYLNQPFEMLGNYPIGVPQLTVTANRSEPGGEATVGWDDEGVSPQEFALVKDGVLADFQTNRESAGWLKESYAKHGLPFRSHGCALAESGQDIPLVFTPNLKMAPGKEALSEGDLLQSLGKGLYFRSFAPGVDFQFLNGLAQGQCFEVVKGKPVAEIKGWGALFRTPEFWKGILALGGPASAERFRYHCIGKGEPEQGQAPRDSYTLDHSVTAVPAVVKQITVIDPTRKA